MKTPFRLLRLVAALAAPLYLPTLEAAEAKSAPATVDKKQAAQQAAVDKVFDLSKLHVIDIVIPQEELARFTQRIDDRLHATFSFDGILLENIGAARQAAPSIRTAASATSRASASSSTSS